MAKKSSALGDYVHLYAKHYDEYGTFKRTDGAKKFNAIDSYQTFKKNRLSNINELSPATIKILEQRLRQDSNSQINEDKWKLENDFQGKIDMIYEYLAERATSTAIGWYYKNAKEGGGWAYSGDYQNLREKTLTYDKIQQKRKIIEQINKKLDKIQMNNGNSTKKELEEINSLYNSLKGNSKKTKSSLGQIQEDIDNLSYYTWISNLAGDFGEMLVAACGDSLDGVVDKSIDDILKRVKGKEVSLISFDKNKVAKNLSKYFKMDETGTRYILGTSPNKVDVEMDINREEVLASVKNYKNTSKVTLQAQTSLLAALLKLNDEGNYANHWLNCHAGRIIKNKGSNAEDALRFELAYDALVGGNPLKENVKQSNVFVLLDRVKGNVIIKSTKDILTKELDTIKIKPDVLGVKLNNTKSKTYQDRITHILMQLHHINFHVAYGSGQE